MSEKFKHIDEYFKKYLKELESETSYNIWKTLYWKLVWKKRAFLIITTIVAVFLISGLLLIYNPRSLLKFTPNPATQIDSGQPQQPGTGLDLNSSAYSDHLKSHQEDKKTLTERYQEVKSDETSTDLISAGIKAIASSEISAREGIVMAYPQAQLNYTILQIPKIQIIRIHDNALFVNDLRKINKMKLISLPTHDSLNNEMNKMHLNKIFSVGMYILPAYVTKSFKAEEAYDDYLDLRSESEDNIQVMGLGAELRLSLKKMYLQSGLEYSVYGENVRYNFTTNTVDIENSRYIYDTTWIWIYDPPFYGESRPVTFDSLWNAVYKKVEMTTDVKNRSHFIEIPLIAGFQTNKRKLNFEIGTGVSFGWLISCKGILPDISLNSLTELEKSTPFLQKTSLNYILNAGIEYKLNETWGILLKPSYKQNLSSFFTKDYDISQKYQTFGVIMGIRIKL